MMPRRLLAIILIIVLAPAIAPAICEAAQFDVEKSKEGVTVKLDGKLFTRYLTRSGAKPVLWPIIGPTGSPMTRQYPIKDGQPGERLDHIHHRSLFFTHGDVNGVDFWGEGKGSGVTLHREFVEVAGGPQAVITTRNDWVDGKGNKVCEDERTFTFGAADDVRWIDLDLTISASEGEVKFGDTKEGTFGIRVAGTMKVESKLGGRVVNSHGQENNAAWGKAAPWVDYHGPVNDKTVGIAILNHPSSFRFPTYWHVRTYGLFAANPFGLHNFKNSNKVDGSHTLKQGESVTFRYRVVLHKGDEKEGNIAGHFSRYEKVAKKK